MFTGIVNHTGDVDAPLAKGNGVQIYSSFAYGDITIGDSIACDGICLTVVDKGVIGVPKPWCLKRWFAYRHRRRSCWFNVELSPETMARTTAARWFTGAHSIPVNLERALRMGDTLDGHIVSGHVDGLATLIDITPAGDSYILTLEAPEPLAKFIAPKGSVTLDGVSLTVNTVEKARFQVNIIPHTWAVTTLGERKAGDALNMEVDMIARYVARLMEK